MELTHTPVAPARERGLKSLVSLTLALVGSVAPARERGLKFASAGWLTVPLDVAPARERGLKYRYNDGADADRQRRSREGAWIEISVCRQELDGISVAPARERGLK